MLVRDTEFQTESRGLQAVPLADDIGPYQVVGVGLKARRVNFTTILVRERLLLTEPRDIPRKRLAINPSGGGGVEEGD